MQGKTILIHRQKQKISVDCCSRRLLQWQMHWEAAMHSDPGDSTNDRRGSVTGTKRNRSIDLLLPDHRHPAKMPALGDEAARVPHKMKMLDPGKVVPELEGLPVRIFWPTGRGTQKNTHDAAWHPGAHCC